MAASIVRATAATAGAPREREDLGALPTWDLDDLYPGRDAPQLRRDLDEAEQIAKSVAERYRGKLASLSGEALGAAVAEYERLDEILSRVMSYAGLVHAGDMQDPEIGRFYQGMQERVTEISTHTLFFQLELNELEDADIEEKLKVPALRHYESWVRNARVFRPHQLAEEMERLLHEKHVAGRSA